MNHIIKTNNFFIQYPLLFAVNKKIDNLTLNKPLSIIKILISIMLKLIILFTILIQISFCYSKISNIPKIPAVYIYESSSGEPLYVGMTDNLARRYYEHLYAKHSYANAKLSYWDMSGKSRSNIFDLERRMIEKYSPKYNKLHNLNYNKLLKGSKELSLKDIFNLDSHLLDISTRQIISTSITIYFQYEMLKEQYNRQKKLLQNVDNEYSELKKRISKTMSKIQNLYIEISREKSNLMAKIRSKFGEENSGVLKKQWNKIKNYFYKNHNNENSGIISVNDYNKYHKKFMIIKREIINEKNDAFRLKNSIEEQMESEKGKALSMGINALLMNIIIPGFSLIEGIALAVAGASYLMTNEFISVCDVYIENLNDIIYLLECF